MLGKEELELLASTSQRNQQLEKDFEQLANVAMSSLRTIDDMKVLIVCLSNALRKAGPNSELPDKVLLYMAKNGLIDDNTKFTL